MRDELSKYIDEAVEYTLKEYYKLIDKIKMLIFNSLEQDLSLEEFKKEAEKIYNNLDISYMQKQIKTLQEKVTEKNTKGHEIINKNAKYEEIYRIEPVSTFRYIEDKYKVFIYKYYEDRYNTIHTGSVDKEIYLKKMLETYDKVQEIVPYYNKDGSIRCYHNIASYLGMLHNTNLLKSSWNTTVHDSKLLDNDLVYLPAHLGACPLCLYAQGKIYSISGKSRRYPPMESVIDGTDIYGSMIGHPNCKHNWLLYWDDTQIQKEKYNSAKYEEYYRNEQKIKSLERRKKNLNIDKKIYKELEDFSKIDKINTKIKDTRSRIKELKQNNEDIING